MSPTDWRSALSEPKKEVPVFRIIHFDPIKVNGQLFGKAIEFNNTKRHIKFSSKFHDPDYLNYDQISAVEIQHDRKPWLYLVGVLTMALVIGFMILIGLVHMPPWKLTLLMKHQKPIVVRVRFIEDEPENFVAYCEGSIPCTIISKKKKKDSVEA